MNRDLWDAEQEKAKIDTSIQLAIPAVCVDHVDHANVTVGMEALTALGLERGQNDYGNKQRDSCRWVLGQQAKKIADLTTTASH